MKIWLSDYVYREAWEKSSIIDSFIYTKFNYCFSLPFFMKINWKNLTEKSYILTM